MIVFNRPLDLESKLEIYNLEGKKVMETKIKKGEETFELNNLIIPKGDYLAHVYDAEKTVCRYKIRIQGQR